MERYVIRCVDCLMFGIPIPPDTKCSNCHSRVTEKWIDPKAVESLRQEFTAKEETYQALLKQNVQQEQELEERDATICGMREALEAISTFWAYGLDKPAGAKPDNDDLRRAENLGIMVRNALSSPTCQHKERVEGVTRAEMAEQARLINERDAAKEEVEKLKEEVKHARSVSPWRSKTIQVEQELADLQAELASLKADNENLMWNLAGCDTYALGYGLETKHDPALARPALDSVRKMALELASLREVAKAAQKVMRCSIPDRDERINDAHFRFSQEYRQALSSHESKWPLKKEG